MQTYFSAEEEYEMGRRYRGPKRAKGYYVERNRSGEFQKWTSIPNSIRVDERVKAKNRPKKTGHGHQGDYEKR